MTSIKSKGSWESRIKHTQVKETLLKITKPLVTLFPVKVSLGISTKTLSGETLFKRSTFPSLLKAFTCLFSR